MTHCFVFRITSSGAGLLYHKLAFREDVRTFTLLSLPLVMSNEDEDNSGLLSKEEKWRPSSDQLRAMDAFVSSMMLDDDNCVGDEDDCVSNAEIDDTSSAERVGLRAAITPERVPNPWILRFFTLVCERGLGNPSLPEVPILTNGWPSLNPTVLPGLDSAILSIEKELRNTSGSSSSPLGRALWTMNRVMPEIIRAPGVDVIPKRKRKDHMAEETVIRKRQAMMSELFGIRDHSDLSETNLTLVASAVTGKQRAEPADPVGDFNEFSRTEQGDLLAISSSNYVFRPLLGSALMPLVSFSHVD
ncbi:unnamed protein product [Mesocestoides corti]|uniref:Condensin complex subunit 2 n=1 Tax=Mesocestoides corti TaxID=53468 RepID=A0A0R3UMC4_MESCO|nr:unnamed protein product [Mesocestoides corti]